MSGWCVTYNNGCFQLLSFRVMSFWLFLMLILYIQILCIPYLITNWKYWWNFITVCICPFTKKSGHIIACCCPCSHPSIRLSVHISVNILVRAIIQLPFRKSSYKVIGLWIRSGQCVAYKTDCSTFLSYTPDIGNMWGYIVFAFPFVRTYVRSFVRSSFRHRVKVFALKFIRPHILKTLWWISFIFGMMVDIGLKFFISTIPTPGVTLGSRSRT